MYKNDYIAPPASVSRTNIKFEYRIHFTNYFGKKNKNKTLSTKRSTSGHRFIGMFFLIFK